MAIPMWLAKAIAWTGIALIVFALVDAVASNHFGLQITGAKWSPVVELAGGFVMKYFDKALDDE